MKNVTTKTLSSVQRGNWNAICNEHHEIAPDGGTSWRIGLWNLVLCSFWGAIFLVVVIKFLKSETPFWF